VIGVELGVLIFVQLVMLVNPGTAILKIIVVMLEGNGVFLLAVIMGGVLIFVQPVMKKIHGIVTQNKTVGELKEHGVIALEITIVLIFVKRVK